MDCLLREKILIRFHDSPFAGHFGVKKTTARIQRRFKWPLMVKEIRDYIRKCELCAKRKVGGDNKSPLNPIPPPDHVWQFMAMDIVGPLTPSGPENHTYILVVGEYLTRYSTYQKFGNAREKRREAYVKSRFSPRSQKIGFLTKGVEIFL